MSKSKMAIWLLRIGLVFVYMYATVEIYLSPANFLKYVPSFVTEVVPVDLFLLVFGVLEVLLAVWLLTGWKGVYPAMLSFFMMAGIIAFNTEYFQVLFRNVAIGFGCLALAVLELRKEKRVACFNAVRQMKERYIAQRLQRVKRRTFSLPI